MPRDLEKILNELKPYRARKAVVDSGHAAFLAIDLQNYFKKIAQPVLANILKVIQSCRETKVPVIFTQHGHTDRDTDRGELGQWWGQVILRGTKDWQFIPEIRIEPEDAVLPKKHYSSFLETDLDEMLRSRGIQDVIISGVMTNLCCETTARDAFMRNYRVFFLVDGTATRRGDLHLATLKNMGFGFAYLITCKELIGMLSSS